MQMQSFSDSFLKMKIHGLIEHAFLSKLDMWNLHDKQDV